MSGAQNTQLDTSIF